VHLRFTESLTREARGGGRHGRRPAGATRRPACLSSSASTLRLFDSSTLRLFDSSTLRRKASARSSVTADSANSKAHNSRTLSSSFLRFFVPSRLAVSPCSVTAKRPLSQSSKLERCISVNTELVATYPSTYTGPEASEAFTPTVSSLFDLHSSGLYRLALAMLHDPDAAQDVVQDTFARLIEHLRGRGALTNPRGWLYTVAAHACRDRQRRSGRWLPWIRERDTRNAPETPDRFDDKHAVLHAIRALSARDRLLVALRAQGLSYQEIGDASGIRFSSVGRLLTRALNRLQKELNGATEKHGRTRTAKTSERTGRG
jgi:RNA polymerase sigma-70 factor, ECF subfamily